MSVALLGGLQVSAIETGGQPMITLESARVTLEWALAMYQSAKQNQPVALQLVDEDAV
jgi:hypothetical protein